MRKVDSDGVERFDARLPVGYFQNARTIGDLLNQGADAQAFAEFSARRVEMARFLGAAGFWYDDSSNAPSTPDPGVVKQFPIAWGDYSRHETVDILAGPWSTQIIAVRIVVPFGPYTTAGRIAVVEFGGGPPRAREISLSRTAGDFRPVDMTGVNGPFRRESGQIVWNRGPGADIDLEAGEYFFNFRNLMIQPGENYDASIEVFFPHN